MASPCALSFNSTTTPPLCHLDPTSSFPLQGSLSLLWKPKTLPFKPHSSFSLSSFSSFSLSSTLSSSSSISVPSSGRIRFCSRRGFHCAASVESSGTDDGMDSADKKEEEVPSMIGKVDWRDFRASLLQQATEKENQPWVHALFAPEVGCVLLAHPQAFTLSQHYFHQAVIFLFHHGKDGSAGVILNRPTEYKLGQLAGFEEFLPEFEECPLYMGGDVGASALHVIHGVPGLQDTREIISGVYMGGFKSMKESIQNGQSKPMDYHWFARYAGWGPGQLEREVAAGVWYLGACSKHFILKPNPIWREILELMGAPYSEIPKRAHGDT